MSNRFEKLMEPGMIGPIKIRNRIIKTANGTSYMDEDQTCGDRMIAFYERLAKGGVGMVVVESCGVEYPLGIQHVHYYEDGSYRGVQLHLDDDRFIPGFKKLTDACHKHGCAVSIQFQHAGPWNPTGLLPRDMKIRDIACASAMTSLAITSGGCGATSGGASGRRVAQPAMQMRVQAGSVRAKLPGRSMGTA